MLGTIRQRMYELLLMGKEDIRSLSQQLKISEKEALAHLPHLKLSARKNCRKLVITPSECLSCGFVFKDRRRPAKPGRCPKCRSTYLSLPAYHIE